LPRRCGLVTPVPEARARGPLSGIRVVELAGMGPAPFCGMVLADLGATVVRVERPSGATRLVDPRLALTNRGKSSIVIDLKSDAGRDVALRLVRSADVLIEGYRPGAAERMGLGPDVCLDLRPTLVYGRMTGWGQDGPLADRAGHDINYTALAGALFGIGPAEQPLPALNLLGDFGGGGMLLAVGVLAALLHARITGSGQVVDAAMVDGVALLATGLFGLSAAGLWDDRRQGNMFDGSRPFYTTYLTKDGGHISVGAIENQFWREFLRVADLQSDVDPDRQNDPTTWPDTHAIVAARIAERTRDEWDRLFARADTCATAVLPLSAAPEHAHHRARETFVEIDGVRQPSPAPRFSASPTATPAPPQPPGADTTDVLRDVGYSTTEIDQFLAGGVVYASSNE
jgi:alpha-methylacyl-CoA racemase